MAQKNGRNEKRDRSETGLLQREDGKSTGCHATRIRLRASKPAFRDCKYKPKNLFCKIFRLILSQNYSCCLKKDRTVNFLDYFQGYINSYTKKDIRMVQIALSRFKDFLKEQY